MNLVDVAFFVGFFGDIFLQLVVYFRGNLAGLRGYFELHGVVESIFIAAALMYFVTWVYVQTGLPVTYLNLAIYGVMLDFVWRDFGVMPSLDIPGGYHSTLSRLESTIIGGAVPMMIVLYFYNLLN